MNATSRALFVLLFLSSAASAQKLTYEEAKARIPSQELPEFWIGGVDGLNPMHDEFFARMGPEAPAILKVAMEEGPDVAVSLHSHGSAPAVLRPAYLPMEIQEQVRRLAQQHNAMLVERNLPHGGVFEAKPEGRKVPSPFNLTSALYHISGAMACTHECPHGIVGEKMCDVTFDEILDVQLTLYEVLIRAALEGR